MRPLYTLILSALLVTTVGCSSNKNDDNTTLNDDQQTDVVEDCSVAELNRWVDFNMRDYYYFADQVARVNLDDYDSPEKLIRDLRVAPNDRFSYVTTIEAYTNYFEAGTGFGFGFSWNFDDDNNARILRIYKDAPFGRAGVRRGDIIISLNGTLWTELEDGQFGDEVGTEEAPNEVTWVMIDAISGEEKTVVTQRGRYLLNTVTHDQTFTTPSIDGQIGYLALEGFIESTEEELDLAFLNFKEQNVQELIIDLRYNGGGRTRLARKLASLIAGPATDDQLLIEYRNNAKYTSNNFSREFSNEPNALGLGRVIVLTTGSTASASEIVINSLAPYMDVVTIGQRTTGKPYISYSVEKCDRSMNAISAEGYNANGVSVLGGIPALCFAKDNPVQDLIMSDIVNITGEIDSMIGAAVDYLETGACRVEPVIAAARSRVTGGPTINKGTGPALADGD